MIEPSSRKRERENELAIPVSTKDIPTERISEAERRQVLVAALLAVPTARRAPRVSRGALIGLGLTSLAFAILLTSTVNHSWRFHGTRLLSAHFMEKAPEPQPALLPPPGPLVEPIVVAAAPAPFDFPPSRRTISRRPPDARARTARANHPTKRSLPAAEAGVSDPTSVAAPPSRAKWIDPFAE